MERSPEMNSRGALQSAPRSKRNYPIKHPKHEAKKYQAPAGCAVNLAIDLSQHMEPIALRLLGEPNKAFSKPGELRYGKHGSLSVDVGKGTWFDFENKLGGGVLDLVERATGLKNSAAFDWLRDQFGLDVGNCYEPRRHTVATYPYTDENGDLLFEVVRFEPKGFAQRRPDGKGGWNWSVKGIRNVPYRLKDMCRAAHDTVLIVEGEKDADRLADLGFVATCNAGGAGKWTEDLSRDFRGLTIYILPDNDDVGRKHAEQVAENLYYFADSVRVVELPGLPEKGDVSDWLDRGGDTDDLIPLCRSFPPWEPKSAGMAEPRSDSGDWYDECIKGCSGRVLSNFANAVLALKSDPRWRGALKFDEMAGTSLMRDAPITDTDVSIVHQWLQLAGLPHVSKDVTYEAVELVARENSFHPVRAYLDRLKWDGHARLNHWLSVYLGADSNEHGTRRICGGR